MTENEYLDAAKARRRQSVAQAIREGSSDSEVAEKIEELLGLWFDVNTKCVHVRGHAEQKMTDIEDKIRSLQKMKRSLRKIMSQCESRGAVNDCPLWLWLDGRNNKAGN